MAQRRYGPTLDAGTAVLEKDAEKTIQPAALGCAAYVGILERGPIGALISTSGKKDLLAKTGGLIPDSVLPDACQDFWDHSKGAGTLFLCRVDDGTGVKASVYLWDRKSPRSRVARLEANNVGRWAGAWDAVVADLTSVPGDITDTVITLPLGLLCPKNKWKGGTIRLTGAGVTYPIVSSTAGTASVRATVTLAPDSTALSDFGSSVDKEATLRASDLDAWGRDRALSFEVLDGQLSPSSEWGLKVYVNDELVKTWPNLSSDPEAVNYFVRSINDDKSNVYVTAYDEWSGAITASCRPANWYGSLSSASIAEHLATLSSACVSVDDSLAGDSAVGSFTFGADVVPDTYELECMSIGPTVWELRSTTRQAKHDFPAPTDGAAYSADNPLSIGFTVVGGGTGPATVLGSAAGPWDLAPEDTLTASVNRAADQTATFHATGAARENTPAEPYHIDDAMTLTVEIDRGAAQSMAFVTADFADHANATAEEVAAAINKRLVGCSAAATTGGTKVTITSDKKGYASYVEVTGGTANAALLFNTAEAQGTGNDGAGHNFNDIDAVTFAELEPILEAAFSNSGGVTCTEEAGGYLRISTVSEGATVYLQVQASSSCEGVFGLGTGEVSGTGGAAQAGDKFTIDILPLAEDQAIGGRIFLPGVSGAPSAGFAVSDNTETTVAIASGDLTVGGSLPGTVAVRLQYRQRLLGGYDGIHALGTTHYADCYDVSSSPFNQSEGQGYGLIKHATPGVWLVGGSVDATDVQKAGRAYAEAKNHQYRSEFEETVTDEFVAKDYLNNTLGRSDFQKVTFPSYGYVADPVKVGLQKLVSLTGAIHGLEAASAKDYDGYHKIAAGIYTVLARVKELPTGDRILDGETLNPAGIGRVERKKGNFVLWGARTTSLDPAWKFAQHRELMSHYEHILQESYDWIIFAINDPEEQPKAIAAAESLFMPEWRKRALRGGTFEDACEIKCDSENNTDATRASGDMNMEISLRLADTVERFIISIGKMGVFESTAAA